MFRIELSKNAAKILESIFSSDRKLYTRLILAIESLIDNPFKGKRLKGEFMGDYSLRVGSYRIMYSVYKAKLVVVVIDLGHRKGIYR